MTPILYSFRRCPYAMRARLAIASSGQRVVLREVVLREKPSAFLEASASGTVPCLVVSDHVIDESLDIMRWALSISDPEGWREMPEEGFALIEIFDGPFKFALDRTKYANRFPDTDPALQRKEASNHLRELDARIDKWIFDRPTIADFAILPFVRQFAFIDKAWFDAQPWPHLQAWLESFLKSDRFTAIMSKYPQWSEGQPDVFFPDNA